LSGVAAAYRLQRAGHEVLVIEAAPGAGGRCKAIHRDGFIVDTCAELVASSYRHWLALARNVGLEGDLVKAPSVLGFVKNGKLVEVDLANPLSLLSTPLLSVTAKFRMVRGAMSLLGKIRAVPPFLLDGVALDEPARTAQDVSLEAFGKEATDYLIDPMLRPLGGTRLDLISTLLVPYALSEWTSMVSLKGGLDRLPLTVAAKLNVQYNTTVDRVHATASNVTIEVRDASGQARTLTADKCLITAQYDDAERIYPRLAELAPGYGQWMKYLRMLDVKLAYRKRPASNASMIMCPFSEVRDINVISLTHNKAPDRAPAGHSLFSVFTEHLEYDRMNAMSDDEVVKLIQPQIETYFPELRGHLLFTRVARQPRTCMLPIPGFFQRTSQLWEAIGREPRVHLGGDIFNFGSLEAAVSSGDYAADRLMKD
jgi:protoporphyrinogen oxidase